MSDVIKMVRINNSHAKRRWEALSHPEVAKWVFIDLPVSFEKTLHWCNTVGTRSGRFDFCFELDGVPVGFAGLVNIDTKSSLAELYIFLHPDFISKGLGSRCLRCLLSYGAFELNLRKVSLYVTGDNTRAIAFYERNGFVTEGVLKQHVWFREQYRDRLIMSVFTKNLDLDSTAFYRDQV